MLPDLGTEIFSRGFKPGNPIVLTNCMAKVTSQHATGICQIDFVVTANEPRMGTILILGVAEAIARQLADWGGTFHAKATLAPNEIFTTDDGQSVVPIKGKICKELGELEMLEL